MLVDSGHLGGPDYLLSHEVLHITRFNTPPSSRLVLTLIFINARVKRFFIRRVMNFYSEIAQVSEVLNNQSDILVSHAVSSSIPLAEIF